MAALQYSDVPGYNALLLRPSLIELQLAVGLIELAHEWLAPTKARWSGETKTWRFPGRGKTGAGGATLTFGYLADASDVRRYAGSSLLVPRLRRAHPLRGGPLPAHAPRPAPGNQRHAARRRAAMAPRLADVPVRVRATSNPGGPGHQWVKNRFVDPTTAPAASSFCPPLADNPHLDQTTYVDTLAQLPTAERERLLHGDWEIPDDGELFQRDWFTLIEPHHCPPARPARCATGTSPPPSRAPPTLTRLDGRAPPQAPPDRAASSTSPTSSVSAKRRRDRTARRRHRQTRRSRRQDRDRARARRRRQSRDRALQAPRPTGYTVYSHRPPATSHPRLAGRRRR